MHEYDALRFEPPAPVASVTLRAPEGGAEERDVPMLIDSGADVTLIPRRVVAALSLARLARTYQVAGFDGRRGGETVAVHAVLAFGGRTYSGQFLVIDEEWGILGRNILNTITLSLDGPRKRWGST